MKIRKPLALILATAVLLVSLGVGMVFLQVAATADWDMANVVGGGKWLRYTDSAVPANNLIGGKQPMAGIRNTAFSYFDNTSATAVTDGNFATNIHPKVTASGYANGDYVPFTFVLDDEYVVEQFLFGNENDAVRYNKNFKIYASTVWEDLYDDDNLLIEATDVDTQVSLLKADGAKRARYVGFAVQYNEGSGSSALYQRVRLSELGVYGEKADKGYTATVVTSANASLLDTLPANLLDTSVVGGGGRYMDKNYSTGDEVYSSRGAATDGKICYVNADLSTGNAERWNEKTGLAPADSADYYYALNGLQNYYIDLQKEKPIDTLLVGLAWVDGSFRKNLWMGRVYVSNSKEDLFAEENCVVAWDERGRVANPAGPPGAHFTTTPAYLFGLEEAVEGRYVGYSLPPQMNNIICVPEIGAYSHEIDWDAANAATGGKWVTYADVTVPEGNLISGKQPMSGMGNKAFTDYMDGTEAANVTDNSFEKHIAPKVTTATNGFADGDYVPFTFVLDDEYMVEKFLVGNINNSAGYYNPDFKIYASTEWETLYDASNLVIDATNVNVRVSLIKANNVKKARYIGFAVQHHDTVGGTSHGGRIRLSELGVYGEKANKGYSVTKLTASNASVLDTLPINMLNTNDVGGAGRYPHKNYVNGDEVTKHRGEATDGIITNVNATFADSANAEWWNEETGLTAGDAVNYAAVNKLQNYYIDLTSNKTIDTLLVGLAREDSFKLSLWMGRIYISDSKDDLFTEENRVATWDLRGMLANPSGPSGSFFTKTPDAPGGYIFRLNEAVEGRYIGYSFPPHANNTVRVPEIGVYDSNVPNTSLRSQRVNSADELTALNLGANLLKGEDVENVTAPQGLPYYGVSLKNSEETTDGYIDWEGKNANRKASYRVSENDAVLWYDLRSDVDISGILFANNILEVNRYRIKRLELYVSDNKDTLLNETSLVGTVTSNGTAIAEYVPLEQVSGRYIAFKFMGDPDYNQVRLMELGVYGTRQGKPVVNLLQGKSLFRNFYVSARTIDNKTSLKADYTNSGVIDPVLKKALTFDGDPADLTNGNDLDNAPIRLPEVPLEEQQLDYKRNFLNYNTPWVVLEYFLDGSCTLEEIQLASVKEYLTDYYLAGYQVYASNLYKDLYKDESLLVTTGGEQYVNVGDEESPYYAPDPTTDVNTERVYAYRLTAEQADKTYRYVSIVITRPYGYYQRSADEQTRLEGYRVIRTSEFSLYGVMTAQEPATNNLFTAPFNGKTATLEIEIKDYDSHAMYNSIGGFEILTSKLPATVERTLDNGWLTVDGDTVYTLRVYDKNGKTLSADVLADYGIELTLPATSTKYTQVGAVLKDGKLTRIVDSYNNADGYVKLGFIDYPLFEHWKVTNKDKAMLFGSEYSFVLMKYNNLASINELNDQSGRQSLADFEGQ